MVREDLQAEVRARRLLGADLVEGLLEGHPIQGSGTVRKELVEHLVHPFLPVRGLHVGVVPDAAEDADRIADRLRLYDELEAVGQHGDDGLNGRLRHVETLEGLDCPFGEFRRLDVGGGE